MQKQEEISQWASKVIGRSAIDPNGEDRYGAHLALGPVDLKNHGSCGWCAGTYKERGWLELAFDKEVIPIAFEIFCYVDWPLPDKIFGRGPANELIEVRNNSKIELGKGNLVGVKVDAKKVQTPIKQFRFEYPHGTGKNPCMYAVRLIGLAATQGLAAVRDDVNQLKGERDRALQDLAATKAQLATCQGERDRALQDAATSKAQLAAANAAKAQLEQDAKKQIDALKGDHDRALRDIKEQLAACQAAKAQVERCNDILQAKLTELQRKLDHQGIQGIVAKIATATVQDVLTLAAYQHVDVSALHADKLDVAHILTFESFKDYFEDCEAEPDQHDGLLKLYATIKAAKETGQLPVNAAVSAWMSKQQRHHDEAVAKKMEEAAARFDEKGYIEVMLYHLDATLASSHLGIKIALLKSIQKDLIASQSGVHLLPMAGGTDQ